MSYTELLKTNNLLIIIKINFIKIKKKPCTLRNIRKTFAFIEVEITSLHQAFIKDGFFQIQPKFVHNMNQK